MTKTPNRKEIREAYSYSGSGLDFQRVAKEQAYGFDQWLRGELARAWRIGYVDSARNNLVNPYEN